VATASDNLGTADPFNLGRFLKAQETEYGNALSELRAGRKRTHWMWYIFPQVDGLAFSSTSRHYAIKNLEEARAYLNHPVLGSRLVECAEAVLAVQGRSAAEILGYPDDLKLCSSATLFASVSPSGSVFERILEKYYQGERDDKTLQLLANQEVFHDHPGALAALLRNDALRGSGRSRSGGERTRAETADAGGAEG
jgi:uncharacterized protein (DUF1810 family)